MANTTNQATETTSDRGRYQICWTNNGGDPTTDSEHDALGDARDALRDMVLEAGDAAWIWDQGAGERLDERSEEDGESRIAAKEDS